MAVKAIRFMIIHQPQLERIKKVKVLVGIVCMAEGGPGSKILTMLG
jgi:hypothetical protein